MPAKYSIFRILLWAVANSVFISSKDKGKTWSEPQLLCPYEGRIYDAVYRNGVIYALEFCNKNFIGTDAEHVYRLFVSLTMAPPLTSDV